LDRVRRVVFAGAIAAAGLTPPRDQSTDDVVLLANGDVLTGFVESIGSVVTMGASGARLRERMDARRAMEEQARAALAAAGSPDAPDAPIARVQSMLDGPMSDAQRSQVEAWLERARRAAADRDEALRAALAERVAAAQRAIDQAEEAARNGGDARALLVTARATVQSIAEDAALPASRKESAAALAPRLEELAARLDAEDASAAARAERVRAVEAIAAQVGDPAAYGAALQAFAEARPDDPLTPSIRTLQVFPVATVPESVSSACVQTWVPLTVARPVDTDVAVGASAIETSSRTAFWLAISRPCPGAAVPVTSAAPSSTRSVGSITRVSPPDWVTSTPAESLSVRVTSIDGSAVISPFFPAT
jgi:hypothetical protein